MPRAQESDIILGSRFTKLTVQERLPASKVRVRCDCGAARVVQLSHLRAGSTKSCGCLRKQLAPRRGQTSRYKNQHGHAGDGGSPTYLSWYAMKQRCFNQNHENFPYYGGRGITVCEPWLRFENFLADMGERPGGKTLDRINPDGIYEPDNCRWATPKEQAGNRRAS